MKIMSIKYLKHMKYTYKASINGLFHHDYSLVYIKKWSGNDLCHKVTGVKFHRTDDNYHNQPFFNPRMIDNLLSSPLL